MSLYALLTSSEDGNPFQFLTSATLAALLRDPSDWGVAEFIGPHDLAELGNDTNHWPDNVAVLLRFEVVVPERARGYSLPAPEPPSRLQMRYTSADNAAAPITLGEVLE